MSAHCVMLTTTRLYGLKTCAQAIPAAIAAACSSARQDFNLYMPSQALV